MELAALISGGKDSMLAMYRMHTKGHNIKYLLTMETESSESYMFHHPNIWITELISKSTGIPLKQGFTEGEKEGELEDLLELIERVSDEVDGIISGAAASTYQKTRIDNICREVGIDSIAPLWHISPYEMWEELFSKGFEVMITAVAAEGLDEKWLGKRIDTASFEELAELSERHRFHLGLEGGEAETLVLDMPLYEKKIVVREARALWDGRRGSYIIQKAVLGEK